MARGARHPRRRLRRPCCACLVLPTTAGRASGRVGQGRQPVPGLDRNALRRRRRSARCRPRRGRAGSQAVTAIGAPKSSPAQGERMNLNWLPKSLLRTYEVSCSLDKSSSWSGWCQTTMPGVLEVVDDLRLGDRGGVDVPLRRRAPVRTRRRRDRTVRTAASAVSDVLRAAVRLDLAGWRSPTGERRDRQCGRHRDGEQAPAGGHEQPPIAALWLESSVQGGVGRPSPALDSRGTSLRHERQRRARSSRMVRYGSRSISPRA